MCTNMNQIIDGLQCVQDRIMAALDGALDIGLIGYESTMETKGPVYYGKIMHVKKTEMRVECYFKLILILILFSFLLFFRIRINSQ